MGREVHNASMKFCGDFQDLVHTSSEFGNSTLLLESLPLKPEKNLTKSPRSSHPRLRIYENPYKAYES